MFFKWLDIFYGNENREFKKNNVFFRSAIIDIVVITINDDILPKISWLIDWLIFGVLTPFSAIFQLYHGDQF